ncbi:MAG: hypothetical protein RLZZ502_1065 [Pseudomonadota bacterium]|jgi:tripartite-type tricarboxylate transporter receptor subunit TctC
MKPLLTALNVWTAISAALIFATPMASFAQTYPDKSVRVIIPFPPGGTLDKIGRMLADDLSKQLGQSFVVDNRAGGNGIIGADAVAKSAADGYTLLFNASTFTTAPMTMKSVPYSVQNDFAPIAYVAAAPLSIATSNALAAGDLKGLAAKIKANPGKLNFAVGSIGSAGHLCTVKLEQAAAGTVTIVPYKGTAPAMQDLLGGRLDGFIDPVLGSISQHKSKQLNVVAVTSNKRLPNLPEVATANETLPGFECVSWYGLWAPAKTSADTVAKLNAAVNKAMNSGLREKLLNDGLIPGGGSVAEFSKFQADDMATSSKIINEKNIRIE